ncbi:hypothetical protein QO179_25095 [Bacillus stercoris]|nr:hypothetical protein [Bacillus stercoris]
MFDILKRKEKLFEEVYNQFYTSADEFIESLEIVKRNDRRERNVTIDYACRLIDIRKRILKNVLFSDGDERRTCPVCGRYICKFDYKILYIKCSCESFQYVLEQIRKKFNLYHWRR